MPPLQHNTIGPPTDTLPLSCPAPAAQPGLGQRAMRTILHATIMLVVLHALAPVLSSRPLPLLLLSYVRPAHYLPFAVALAGGLNADRIILITLAAVIILTTWPADMLPYAIAATIGIVFGASIRALIIQEKTNG